MKGVIVTGHMRSGTSMVAGLFAAHGVFFGDCGVPNPRNEKGNFENQWLKRQVEAGHVADDFFERLAEEGYVGDMPWGAKVVAVHWPKVRPLEPDVVVNCYRPKSAIVASCEASWSGWKYGERHRSAMVEAHWRLMETIKLDYPGCVVDVDTPELVAGDYETVLPAFDGLGLEFSAETADTWIDRDLWHHGAA